MTELFNYFDAYTLKARVFPALVAGLPTLALLVVIVPWNHLGLPHITAAVAALVLLFAFADVARRTGKHVQAKLGTGRLPSNGAETILTWPRPPRTATVRSSPKN